MAWAAWYWHAKNVRGELAKGLVVLLGLAVVAGEVVHFTKSADSRPQETVQLEPSFNPEAHGGVPVYLSCPGALPADTITEPLAPNEVSKIIGSEGKLDNGDANWDANLTYVNTTKDKCVTAAIVELDLSYGGRVSKERHNIAFNPPLGPGKSQLALPLIQAPKRGEEISLVEWHTVSVSGFEARSNPFDEVFRDK